MILVTGATGFVGTAITTRLLATGYSVRAMTRSLGQAQTHFAETPEGLKALGEGRLTFIQGDVTEVMTLLEPVEGVEAIIHAVQFAGAPAEDQRRRLTYMNVDRNGTLNLLAVVAQVYGKPTATPALARYPSQAPRFLYMSGITVSEDSRWTWDRAKWQAEEAIRGSGLDWTILRASWLFGPGDAALNRIIGYSSRLPFVPTFGDGEEMLTPLFIDDLARFCVLLVQNPEKAADTTFMLGGPELVTMNDFLRLVGDVMNRKRPILHIPKPVGKVQAAFMQLLPGRPLTPDAVDFASQGGAATDMSLIRERFPDFRATPLQDALASYLAPGATHDNHR